MKSATVFLLQVILLMMTCSLNAQVKTLTLQPGPSEGQDVLFRDDIPYVNFGDDVNFTSNAWTVGGVPCILRSLIKFDLSGIPVDAQVVDARLSLYCNDNSGIYQLQAGDNASYLLPVLENWDEHTVNWVNQPNVSTVHSVILPSSVNMFQDYPNIEVTEAVQDMVSNPATNYGWMIRLITEQLYSSMVFGSSDCTVEEWRPKLVIRYTSCDLPVARFSYQVAATRVTFADSSSSAISWYWNFGDGYYSDLQNPVHEYDQPGKYRVCLVVEDSCGTSEFCDTVPACHHPETSFSFTASDHAISFSDLSYDAISWFWSFGDGFFSDLKDPVHVFNEYGHYYVCLTSRNGCDQETFCDSVVVKNTSGTGEKQYADLVLYPNPAQGYVMLRIPDDYQADLVSYEIISALGITRKTGLFSPGPRVHRIDLTHLAPGLYFLRAISRYDSVLRKFTIQ